MDSPDAIAPPAHRVAVNQWAEIVTTAVCVGASLLALGIAGLAGLPAALGLLTLAGAVHRRVWNWHVSAVPALLVVGVALWAPLAAHTHTLPRMSPADVAVFVNVGVLVWGLAALGIIRRLQGQLHLTSVLTERLAANFAVGMCTLDAHGQVQRINAEAERILGWPSRELKGRDFLHVTRALDSAQWNSFGSLASATANRKRELREEITVTSRSGRTRRLSCVWVPILTRGRARKFVLVFRDVTDQRQLQAGVEERDASYRALIDALPDPVLVSTSEGVIVAGNAPAGEFFGWKPGHLDGRDLAAVIVPEDRERVAAARARANERIERVEVRCVRRNGAVFSGLLLCRQIAAPDPSGGAFLYVCREIADRGADEERTMCSDVETAASAALARACSLADAVNGLLTAVGEEGQWDAALALAHRPGSTTLTQYAFWHRDASEGEPFRELLERHPVHRGLDVAGKVWESSEPMWVPDTRVPGDCPRAAAAATAGFLSTLALPVRARGEVVMVIELYGRETRPPQPELVRLVSSLATHVGQFVERARVEQELVRQALHDALTTLPNRTLLHRRVQGSIAACAESGNRLALLLLDLDRFKEVNDTLGHPAGDSLLQEVARRLQATVRKSDTVARLGGDEFAVLLPGSDGRSAAHVASSIVAALRQPFERGGHILDVGTSIGIATYPEDGKDFSTLMQHADVAMYIAKQSHTGISGYSPELDRHSPERLGLTGELRLALERQQLRLVYQPKVNLETGEIGSVEALVRWIHPTRGLLLPGEFIPLAEESGLARALTGWVLHEAIRQCRRWKDAGLDLHVAVNLFPQTLHDQRMVEDVRGLLERYRVDAHTLTLEITESAVMADPEGALETLRRFRDLGIRISIDDFGTGYSSLLYLKRLPVDELKIDKSFVLDMATENDDAFIARAIIDLGHNLGLSVIAEGVQSQESWNMLQQIGCDYLQGFYVSEPLAANELEHWMRLGSVPDVKLAPRSA